MILLFYFIVYRAEPFQWQLALSFSIVVFALLPCKPTPYPFHPKEMAKDASFRRFIIVDDNTIRETRDRQEEKRPRKRARVDSDDEEPTTIKTNNNVWSSLDSSDKPGERDPLYYLDDDPTATCIFRVGDVLFKVRDFFVNIWFLNQKCHCEMDFLLGKKMKDPPGNIRLFSVHERSVKRSSR